MVQSVAATVAPAFVVVAVASGVVVIDVVVAIVELVVVVDEVVVVVDVVVSVVAAGPVELAALAVALSQSTAPSLLPVPLAVVPCFPWSV